MVIKEYVPKFNSQSNSSFIASLCYFIFDRMVLIHRTDGYVLYGSDTGAIGLVQFGLSVCIRKFKLITGF